MRRGLVCTVALLLPAVAPRAALAQIESLTVDMLDPSDAGYEPLPPNRVILDVHVGVAETDVWTAAGLRVAVEDRPGLPARLVYADTDDPNTAQPDQLVNPGFENRLYTSLSKPRQNRHGLGRFENALVAIAGAYLPAGPVAVATESELNVAYFAGPPESPGSPSVDGYIARIALDVDRSIYPPWIFEFRVGQTLEGTAIPVARIEPPWFAPPTARGLVSATYDDPHLAGGNWYLYLTYVPEPGTLLLALPMMALARRRR